MQLDPINGSSDYFLHMSRNGDVRSMLISTTVMKEARKSPDIEAIAARADLERGSSIQFPSDETDEEPLRHKRRPSH